MASAKLRGKDLRKIGYPEHKVIGIAINVMKLHYKRNSLQHQLKVLKAVLRDPETYLQDEVLGQIARALLPAEEKVHKLREEKLPYAIYGADGIELGAVNQMELAMRLPVAVGGALMADAHHGYGLPIGGVLAVENAVIPYGVGMDIGCRMCLTVYDLPERFIGNNRDKLMKMLAENTRFGNKQVFDDPADDEIFERAEFHDIKAVKELKGRAWQQIGTSGSGNHFVEFGEVEIVDPQNEFELPLGRYVGVLSHSGSRGLGANIARHYTRLAKVLCPLPGAAKHLAWLKLDSQEGHEYWQAMNLAGDYASACHHDIHRRLGKALGEVPLMMVENHHNFAWKEQLPDGREVIVHRKGATPAGEGVLGIIPGSMTAPGFIVRGKGRADSINSASHGAGRVMSRTRAKNTLQPDKVTKFLKDHGVELLGGGLDEAPMAYKDIHEVMRAQAELVDVIGKFIPKVVRMDG